MLRKLTAVMLLGALLLSSASLWAQNELSEEEAALLQRFIDGSEGARSYDSFVAVQINSQAQTVQALSDGVVIQEQETSTVDEITTNVMRGDNPNGMREMVRISDDGASIIESRVELRYVDGVIYGSGRYIESEGPLTFPDGFVEVDLADPGIFEDFELEDFQRVMLGERDEDNPLGNYDTMLPLVDSVSSGEGDFEGETVEVITVTIPGVRLLDLLVQLDPEGFGNPQTAALFGAATDESYAAVQIFLDADGLPLAREVVMLVEIADVLLNELDPTQPEGVTINAILTLEQTSTLSQINEELPPVSAP